MRQAQEKHEWDQGGRTELARQGQGVDEQPRFQDMPLVTSRILPRGEGVSDAWSMVAIS